MYYLKMGRYFPLLWEVMTKLIVLLCEKRIKTSRLVWVFQRWSQDSILEQNSRQCRTTWFSTMMSKVVFTVGIIAFSHFFILSSYCVPNDPLGSECCPHGACSLVRETGTIHVWWVCDGWWVWCVMGEMCEDVWWVMGDESGLGRLQVTFKLRSAGWVKPYSQNGVGTGFSSTQTVVVTIQRKLTQPLLQGWHENL